MVSIGPIDCGDVYAEKYLRAIYWFGANAGTVTVYYRSKVGSWTTLTTFTPSDCIAMILPETYASVPWKELKIVFGGDTAIVQQCMIKYWSRRYS